MIILLLYLKKVLYYLDHFYHLLDTFKIFIIHPSIHPSNRHLPYPPFLPSFVMYSVHTMNKVFVKEGKVHI